MELLLTEVYSRSGALESAVKNRRIINFYYAGPRKGKNSVKAGGRYEVEPVAIGMLKNKKNIPKLAIRGWVENKSSVTKTGFAKGQWRTFLVNRMHQVKITNDIFGKEGLENYKDNREGYKENNDASFSKLFATVDWSSRPYRIKIEPGAAELSRREREKRDKELELQKHLEPKVEPTEVPPTELPQPKPVEKPPVEPEIKAPEPEPQIEPTPTPEIKPTEPEIEIEPEGDEEEKNVELQEAIKKIKHLMFF